MKTHCILPDIEMVQQEKWRQTTQVHGSDRATDECSFPL
jgi:hypothetical protein